MHSKMILASMFVEQGHANTLLPPLSFSSTHWDRSQISRIYELVEIAILQRLQELQRISLLLGGALKLFRRCYTIENNG